MKNTLSPLSASAESPAHFEPSRIYDGYKFGTLGIEKFKFRPDLDGVIYRQNGCPVVETESGLHLVVDSDDSIRKSWLSALKL
jgi:hypothetical protein